MNILNKWMKIKNKLPGTASWRGGGLEARMGLVVSVNQSVDISRELVLRGLRGLG